MDKAWTSAKHLPTPCPHSPPSRPPPHRFNNNDSSQRQLHRHRNLPGLFRHPRQSVDGIVRSNTVRFQRNKVTNNTRSTDRVLAQAARCRPIVPAMSPRHARAFAMHTRPSPQSIPRRLRQTDRRNRVSGVAWATSAVHSRARPGRRRPTLAGFRHVCRREESLGIARFVTRARRRALMRTA